MDQRRAEMLLYKKQVQLLGNEGAKRCSKTHLNRIKYRMKQDHTCLKHLHRWGHKHELLQDHSSTCRDKMPQL